MHESLIAPLKAMWPVLKAGQAECFFLLAIGREPVLQLYRRENEADHARFLTALRKVQPAFRADAIIVGKAEWVDQCAVLVPNQARSLGRTTSEKVTKALVGLANALTEALPEVAPALKKTLYQAGGEEEGEALTLDATSWRTFSNKRFSRRSPALKAIDGAFDAYDPDASPPARLEQLALLSRALEDWLASKEGASGRMGAVQSLAVQVARERARLTELTRGGVESSEAAGMTPALLDKLKEILPVARANAMSFALAPNRGRPLLALARIDLDGGKARTLFSDGGASYDPSPIYIGDVRFQDGVPTFLIRSRLTVGTPDAKDARNRLLKLATDRTVNAVVDLSSLRGAVVTVDNEVAPTVAQTITGQPSNRSRFLRGTYAKIRDTVDRLATVPANEREATEDKLRDESVKWLEKHHGSTTDRDVQRRGELWEAVKLLGSTRTVATRAELNVATRELRRELDELLALDEGHTAEKREGLARFEGALRLWLDKAEEQADRAALIELHALLHRTERAMADLDREAGVQVLDPDEVRARLVRLETAIGLMARTPDRREELAAQARRIANELLEYTTRNGMKPEAARARMLAGQIDRPWSFEPNLPWKPHFRVELRGACERAGMRPDPVRTWEQRDQEKFEAIERAIVEGQRIRVDARRLLVDVGYPLQQLRETNLAVFQILHGLTPGFAGREVDPLEPPNYAEYEQVEAAFANPETRAAAEILRDTRVAAGRRLLKNPNFLAYDKVYTDDKVDALRQQVETAGNGAQALAGLLADPDAPGVILAEQHTRGDAKGMIVDNLAALKQDGVDRLYIEHFRVEEHQALLDAYLDTGEMPEELDAYLRTQALKFPGAAYPHDLRGILEQARAHGIRVYGIDSMGAKADPGLAVRPRQEHERDVTAGDVGAEQRAARMNGLASEVVARTSGGGGKFIMLLGAAHANTHAGGSSGVPGMSQLTNAPVLDVNNGGKRLLTEDRAKRGKVSEPGDRGTLRRAITKPAVLMNGTTKGHRMHFEMEISFPPDATGEDFAGLGTGIHTLYGVEFEWWERIAYHWRFNGEGMTAGEIVQARATGQGGSVKPWGDLFQYQTSGGGGTLGPWVTALERAAAHTLVSPATIVINDQPGIALNPGNTREIKRVLQFRHVAKDSYGKTIQIEAVQVLVVEGGALAYALYRDSLGHFIETNPGGRPQTDFIAPGEGDAKFDLDVDLDPAFEAALPGFLEAIADGKALPFTDISLNAVLANMEQYKCREPLDQVVGKVTFQAYNMLPPARPGDRYVEWPVPGAGILVALLSGDRLRRMYTTTEGAGDFRDINIERGDIPPVDDRPVPIRVAIPVRTFVEIPVESLQPGA